MTIFILAEREPYRSYPLQYNNEKAEGPSGPFVILGGDDLRQDSSADILVMPARVFATLSNPQREARVVFVYGEVAEMEAAFELGCADFLREPWSMAELLVRAGRCARPRLYIDGVEFVLDRGILRQGERSVLLTESERRLTTLFANSAGMPLTREAIAWALNDKKRGSSRSLDNHIASLRKKIDELYPGAGKRIKTVRGIGYRLT
jgi:DNA-binding response OmpR family regulator